MTDYFYLDSTLHNSLALDPYLTQQYIEATQIIADLQEHLISVGENEAGALQHASQSVTIGHLLHNDTVEKVPASSTDEDDTIADLNNVLGELTDYLKAQLCDYSDRQGFSTNSVNRFGAANMLCDDIDEIEQLLIPLRFDEQEN